MKIYKDGETHKLALRDFVSTTRKIELVGTTLLESEHEDIINPMLLEIFFRVNLILGYTDIQLEDFEKEDKVVLYDVFKENNLWEDFEKEMLSQYPEDIQYLWNSLMQWVVEYKEYKTSFLSVVNFMMDSLGKIIETFSENAESLKDIDWKSLVEINEFAEKIT